MKHTCFTGGEDDAKVVPGCGNIVTAGIAQGKLFEFKTENVCFSKEDLTYNQTTNDISTAKAVCYFHFVFLRCTYVLHTNHSGEFFAGR